MVIRGGNHWVDYKSDTCESPGPAPSPKPRLRPGARLHQLDAHGQHSESIESDRVTGL